MGRARDDDGRDRGPYANPELIGWLSRDYRVRNAAIIGSTFGMDPRVVLAAGGLDKLILIAANNVAADEKNKQNKK